jgi:hypothetical protein
MKQGRGEKVVTTIDEALTNNRCSPATAASMKGQMGFISAQLTGKIARGAERALSNWQYTREEDVHITQELRDAMEFIKLALRVLPPRRIPLEPSYTAPTLVYSDAAYEEGSALTTGFIVFSPKLKNPMAGWASIPNVELVAAFGILGSYIMQGEAIAAVVPWVHFRELLRDADVLCFVDSQAALSALVGGASSSPSLARLASVWQITYGSVSARVWAEWVESAANIADGPSRLLAKWRFTNTCKELGATYSQIKIPAFASLFWTPIWLLKHVFE